jgi:transposase
MDILQTLPVAETASESLAPGSNISPTKVEAPVGVPLTACRLRLRRANREDVIRVPARLEDWLPPDHPARQVWETVKSLDLTEFYVEIQVEDGTPGAPATDPLLLVAVWVYATSQGETCARAVADLCVNHVAYIWLCGGVSMNYHTLSDFLTRYGAALDQLMTQVVQRMRDAGLIEFEAHAQDGMRVRASAGAASFHREATLSKSLEKAQAQVQVLEQARAAETSDLSAREQAAQERAAQERVERLTAARAELPAVRAVKPVDERGDARVSSTDPEARVMKMADGGFRPAYNWEFVVDTARLVITGVEVVNAGSDKAQTLPMLEQDQRRGGRLPHDWLMDGGFVTLSAIEAAEVDQRVRVIAPVPEPKDETRDRYAPLPSDSSGVAAWRQRMGTDEAKETYKLRAATVECVNAQARTSHGVYQVRVRGRAKVRCVALWVAITHNLLIWIRDAHAQTSPASLVQPVSLA